MYQHWQETLLSQTEQHGSDASSTEGMFEWREKKLSALDFLILKIKVPKVEESREQITVGLWRLQQRVHTDQLYLESFNSLLSSGGGHNPLLDAGDRPKAHLVAQRARGWRSCQGTNRCCGEMARALVLWGYQVSILIVLNVFEVWANSRRERRRGKKGTKQREGVTGPR